MDCLIVDFTGPVNLRGTPIFTHINGSVTRVMISVTWDAVEAQVYNNNNNNIIVVHHKVTDIC